MEGSEMIPALLIEALTKGVEMCFFVHGFMVKGGEKVLLFFLN